MASFTAPFDADELIVSRRTGDGTVHFVWASEADGSPVAVCGEPAPGVAADGSGRLCAGCGVLTRRWGMVPAELRAVFDPFVN